MVKTKSLYYESPKKCKFCGTIIPYEKRNNKFCNHSCSASYNNREVDRWKNKRKDYGKCLYCGKELNRKQNKYCCLKHKSEHAYKIYIKKWIDNTVSGNNDSHISGYVRRWMIENIGSCEMCGEKRVNPYSKKPILQVHHIDGNKKNSARSNLKLLCPTCHSLTETYCGLNINKL